jgi:hypothetical protein
LRCGRGLPAGNRPIETGRAGRGCGSLSLPDVRPGLRRLCRTKLLHLTCIQRPARICGQSLLPLHKWHGRRRWRSLGDDGSLLNRLGRLRNARCGRRPAQHALATRRYRRGVDHRCRTDRRCLHWHRRRLHRPGVRESVLRDSRHCTGRFPIHIADVGGVYVGDVNVVYDSGVRHVDTIDVRWTGSISRHVDFTRAQRKPSDTPHATAYANR